MAKDGGKSRSDERPDESEAERLDRNYGELLQEMRVLQAGVQILFAFLLTIAFQSSFAKVTGFQRDTYLVTLISAALATACIIGPVPFHRVVFRRGMKADLIQAATRYVSAGLAFFFVSITGAVLLVLDFLLSRTTASIVTAVLAAAFLVLWVVMPFLSRAEEEDDAQDEP
ncbi:MAG: amine oxidase [Nocardioidaceae bacterium]|nr:amine oxidase [Nocardioidaceae bacterium]